MAKKPAPTMAPQAESNAADPRDALIVALQSQVADLAEKFGALTVATGGMTILPPEEMPLFEVGSGNYYSADDVFYPEGTQIEDITGRMPLNESLIPLNIPAEDRMIAYLSSLPKQGTPMHEYIIEAAGKVLPQLSGMGDTPEARAQINAKILEMASTLAMKAKGLMPDERGPRLPVRSQRAGNVPIMPNTRIRHDASPVGHVAPPVPVRGAPQTRVRAQATAAANKAAPVMGTVQTTNTGRAGPGVQAA